MIVRVLTVATLTPWITRRRMTSIMKSALRRKLQQSLITEEASLRRAWCNPFPIVEQSVRVNGELLIFDLHPKKYLNVLIRSDTRVTKPNFMGPNGLFHADFVIHQSRSATAEGEQFNLLMCWKRETCSSAQHFTAYARAFRPIKARSAGVRRRHPRSWTFIGFGGVVIE